MGKVAICEGRSATFTVSIASYVPADGVYTLSPPEKAEKHSKERQINVLLTRAKCRASPHALYGGISCPL